MKHFREQKAEVFRSAGSHSQVDVIVFEWFGIPWYEYRPLLVQCKTGKHLMTAKEKKDFQSYGDELGCHVALAYREKRKLVIERLH